MPRKRLRPDYVCRLYTYHTLIVGEPPQVLWDTARAMDTLWNRCVTLHEIMREPWRDHPPEKATQKEAYKALLHGQGAAYLACRDGGEELGLSAWQKWYVYDTFQNAMRNFARGHTGPPRMHHGLRKILIPHRTESGGVPVSWLERDAPAKHTAILPPVKGHHHRDAYTTIGGQRVHLRILMHRPLPDDAILKRVALLGTFEPSLRRPGDSGWQWRFQCTVELPPPSVHPVLGRSAGIDVGWRVRPEWLRIAMVSDGIHTWEIGLPWDMSSRKQRRRQAYYAQYGATLDATTSWRALWAWQERIDAAIEECKADIAEMDQGLWPVEAHQYWKSRTKWRAGGLRRFQRILRDADIALKPLDEWASWHAIQMRRLRGAQLHLFRARNHGYRLLAHWIAQHFDALALEKPVGLKTFAEAPNKRRKARGKVGDTSPLTTPERVERSANKYRQIAGISLLHTYLREAMQKCGRQVIEADPSWTSRTCTVCGETLADGLEIMRECPQGHRQDQDVSAAFLLWQSIPGEYRQEIEALYDVDTPDMRPLIIERIIDAR